MNLISWLFPTTRAETTSVSDLRNPRLWLSNWIGRRSLSGVDVTPATALTVGSVFACVRNLSEDVGKLPLILYRRKGEGKVRATDDARYRLMRKRPNDYQTAFTFRSTMTGWAILHGYAVAQILRDGVGRPLSLQPIHPANVRLYTEEDGRILYRVNTGAGFEILEQDDVLHVNGFSDDGVLGHMMADLAQESIGLAIAADQYAASYFGNGATLGGILKHPGKLSDKASEKLRNDWAAMHGGPENAHKTAILEEGMAFEKTSESPKDSQGIEYRQFNVEDVARWFRMPPHKIGHLLRSTFSNIEHQAIEYVTDTLQPWCVRWEQESDRKLLDDSDELFYEHLLDALLRGDTPTRTQALTAQFLNGALTLNEWRAIENRNPLPPETGDVHFVPLNLTPIDKAIANEATAPEPTQQEAAQAQTVQDENATEEPDPVDESAVAAAALLPVFVDAFARVVSWGHKAKASVERYREYMRAAITPAADALVGINGWNLNPHDAASAFVANRTQDDASPRQLATEFVAALQEASHETNS
jgi:HK97 family phage portal protein